ncbi:MAG: hypothetical protein ACOYXN_08600 [Acidobacteriota bacterium]
MKARRLGTAALALALALVSLGAGPAHRFEASGSRGWIKFSGGGRIRLEGKGTLKIRNASNLQLEVQGTWGSLEPVLDGADYYHFQGSVDSVGLGGRFEIRGWDLRLTVHGRGKARFRGEGSCRLDEGQAIPWTDHPERWTKVDFED